MSACSGCVDRIFHRRPGDPASLLTHIDLNEPVDLVHQSTRLLRASAPTSGNFTDTSPTYATALLAFLAYHRGDRLASVALEAALASDPQHRFVRFLDTALRDGTSSPRLHAVANYAHDIADALGVDLHS